MNTTITFHGTELHLQPHPEYEFLLSNKEVALGYGITQSTLRSHFNNNKDELIEGKHWLRLEVQTRGGKQKVIHWTKEGIVRLGFFIKSQQAKEFRDWAEDYIVNDKQTYINRELEIKLLEKNSLIFQLKDEIYALKNRNKNLVRALNTLTKQKEENLQSELARIGNNALEIIFQIENIQKELEETKKGIETKLNRVEIFKKNIERVMPKPALVGINKKGEKEYVEIPLSQLKK